MARPSGDQASERAHTAPTRDDPRKPRELSEISTQTWAYVVKKTVREFIADRGHDLAAALTFYGVLAVFPGLLAFVSLVGLFGDPRRTTDGLIDLLGGVVAPETLDALRDPIAGLASSPNAGLAFAAGVAGALWASSIYVNAFSRMMNQIYSIQEGRPIWKLRTVTLGVTVLAVLIALLAALILTLSGSVAGQVGQVLGVGSTALVVWNIVKWPILLFLAVVLIAVLYYATPNVRQPRFRWMSLGALLALGVWALASGGLLIYAANFSSFTRAYGAIGAVIVALLWVWISNMALVFGAEFDAELERGRQLQAGIKAEETIQLPPRDTKTSDKAAQKHAKDVAAGRRLREEATGARQ